MLTDTHTHLYDEAFAPDGGGAAAVRRALEAGVGRMVFPNVDMNTIEPMKALAGEFPGAVRMAMGLHPTEIVAERLEEDLRIIRGELAGGGYVAVGEVGMDLYWTQEHVEEQKRAFGAQCGFAREFGLPLIIHCREALKECLEVLEDFRDLRVVFHSFGGSREDVEAIRGLLPGAYFGINGIVTFKNSGLREVLPEIGLGSILLETDSPYLAPVPKRGRRNESAYLPFIAATVAGAFGTTAEVVAARTSENAAMFFGD